MEKEMPSPKRLSTNVCKLERDGGVVTNNRPEKAGSGSQQHQADLVPQTVESLHEEQLDPKIH